MRPVTFDSANVDEIEAFVSALYSRMRIGAAGEHTRTRITRQVMSPEVAFDDVGHSFDLDYDADPQPYLIVSDVVANSMHPAGDVFGPGDVFLACRPGVPYTGVVRGARLRNVTMDPALLSRVACGGTPETAPVRLLGHRPASPQAVLALRRAIAYVRDSVLAVPAPQSALIVATAGQYLAARVLDAFPNTAVTTPAPGDRHDANPNALRRAVSFIEAHPDAVLAVTDIARAACVTPRALQLAFRRHLDTTPMGYLRRVRLGRAHDDLCAATAGDGLTITAIAYRWGFTSSRFTQQYRATYGRTPGQTLRE